MNAVQQGATGSRRRTMAIAAMGAAVGIAVLAVFGIASADPGAGVKSSILAKGTIADKLDLTTRGASDVVFQLVTIQPGGRTGWHTHAGRLLVVVKSGTLTRYTADCKATTYSTGRSFVETEDVHEGRNEGTVPVELYVTYVDPVGSALRAEAGNPGCRL